MTITIQTNTEINISLKDNLQRKGVDYSYMEHSGKFKIWNVRCIKRIDDTTEISVQGKARIWPFVITNSFFTITEVNE